MERLNVILHHRNWTQPSDELTVSYLYFSISFHDSSWHWFLGNWL